MNDNFSQLADKDLKTYCEFVKRYMEKSIDRSTDVHANLDKYSSYDIIQVTSYYSGKSPKLAYIELKGRYYRLDDFPDCAIEAYKVSKLQRQSWLTGIDSWLVGLYYYDNKVAMWKIDPNRTYNPEQMFCNSTTADNGDKQWKSMVKFPLSEARIFEM